MLVNFSHYINKLIFDFVHYYEVKFLFDYVYFIALILKVFIAVIVILLSVAYSVWLERKIHALVSLRKGPNVVGIYGLLQPIFDGIKLLLKEMIIPKYADKYVFILAPIVIFVISLMGWAVIPVANSAVFADLNFGLLYLLATSSLSVYGIIMAGWASKSKYAFLGAIRSSAQMISYEISMGVILL